MMGILRPVRLGDRVSRREQVRLLVLLAGAWVFCGVAHSAVTLVHRPYLQNLSGNHVTIMWSARENLAGSVQYSTDSSFTQQSAARIGVFTPSTTNLSFTFYQYTAELTGLAPGATYSYRIAMGSAVVPDTTYRFRTAGPGPFSFLVFGDSGAGTAGQVALTLQMVNETPNLVLQVGDIAYEDGTFEQFQANFFDYYFSLLRQACFFMVPGNHEYYTANAAPYLALQSPPTDTVPAADSGRYYSFDWGDAHFVGLDSNLLADAAAASRMLDWLERDLTNSHATWRIAYFHHLPYPESQHVDDPLCLKARTDILPILERHEVQLVLTGHEHSYQRSKPLRGGQVVKSGPATVYITTGGGGGVPHPSAPRADLDYADTVYHYLRVTADAGQLTVKAIGTDGKAFDTVTLTQPTLAPGNPLVNGASFTPQVAPGGLVSIFGQGLSTGTGQATSLPLPIELAGTTVTVNGIQLPLIYASPSQINAQLPLGVLGTATLRVATFSGFAEATVTISRTAPAIFPNGILHANYAPVTAAAPARAGETLVLYVTGLGSVDGPIATGAAAPASPLLRVPVPVEVRIGDVAVLASFAGLSPGFVGLYQVNIVVPLNLPAKLYPFYVAETGSVSAPVDVQVQQSP